MRIVSFVCLSIMLNIAPLYSQQLQGRVYDLLNGEPLADVTVFNHSSQISTTSQQDGLFRIAAMVGDTIEVSMTGFYKQIVPISNNTTSFLTISLKPKMVSIDTVLITPGLTKRQQDSLTNRTIYGKKVTEKPAKFKRLKPHPLYGGSGKGLLNYDAPISSIIQKRTKKYKRLKAFQDRFMKDETQSFIDSRYTATMVAELTSLQGDSLQLFMNAYAMPLDLAKDGSELEMKSWVKYNYKVWKGEK